MIAKNSVLVVGGGIMGLSSAYALAQKGLGVTLIDQFDVPNSRGASGDQLRVFCLTYGKDAFYTELAIRALPLWLDLNKQAEFNVLEQNGVLELATKTGGYEDHSFDTLKDMKIPVLKLDKKEIGRRYPMINTRAIRYGLFHKDGGMIWAQRACSAISTLAQRKGAKIRSHVKAVSILRDKNGICGVKDAAGILWQAETYLFAAGFWTPELLKSFKLPIKITRQEQLYLRPLSNRGRYRPEHFPVFMVSSGGFYGFPLHIHGFLKMADHTKGPIAKFDIDTLRESSPAFERKCRTFLKKFIPELTNFTEMEGHICYYDNTPDDDFIVDRLPGMSNAYVAAGFSGHGFKFGPVIGAAAADLIVGAVPKINLHRFRLSRFSRKG